MCVYISMPCISVSLGWCVFALLCFQYTAIVFPFCLSFQDGLDSPAVFGNQDPPGVEGGSVNEEPKAV